MERLAEKARALNATDFGRSRQKNKRFYVVYQGKKINFGLKGAKTYIDHRDEKKRASWKARHTKIKLKSGKLAYKDPRQPAFWSHRILWP